MKKGYMSVRPGKHRKIFVLYEDSFHDFKGRYFKIFSVGDHRPFWLSLVGDGRFPPYWSDQAGFEIVPATYQQLNADQRDTADILVHLFAQNNLNPKFLMNNSDEARKAVVEMAGNDVTLARLRRLIRPAPAKSLPSPSTAVPPGGARSVPVESVGKTQAEPEGGSSTNVGRENVGEQHVEISSPIEEEIPLPPPPSPKRRRSAIEDSSGPKRSRTLEGAGSSPGLRSSGERPLGRVGDDPGCHHYEIGGASSAKLKVEEDLKVVKVELEELEREKDAEADRFRRREEGLQAEVEKFRGLAAEEKVRADLAEASAADLQKQCEDLAEDAKAAVAATEGVLKAQLAVLLPDFDTDQISYNVQGYCGRQGGRSY
ncbi:hypothetical protein PIB30_054643 [Stylosanthes scabra]|uniref:Uncharacterized protein n=1 Tax=Stylosanthes scabra TaxID=79078 RepID=A0ABU6XHZ6_9FABA|nr:hypothetical protein [Stylosanthes scabra]